MASVDRRSRRRRSVTIDKMEIVNRVIDFYQDDLTDTTREREIRLQRYAKMRGWTEGKDWPWEDSCFTLDTEILSSTGWKPIGDVEVGEFVYSRSPEGGASYRPVVEKTRAKSFRLVCFEGKSIDLRVTPNHRMLVEDWKGEEKFVEARYFPGMSNKDWHIPLTSEWTGEKPTEIYGIDAAAYVRLLGWYVSEGWSRQTGSIFIGQLTDCGLLEQDLAKAGVSWKKHKASYTLHARSMPCAAAASFRELGRSASVKHLPDFALNLCPSLLRELLETLVAGDGHVRPDNGHTSYYTTSPILADQVQIIAQRIGLRATIAIRTAEANSGGVIRGRKIVAASDIYIIRINKKPLAQVRKIRCWEEVEEEEQEFACVTVPPYHTLYVRRNGKAVWCGNSDIALTDIMEKSLRMQDTVHNAVMTQRPPVGSKAHKKGDKEKEKTVDQLIDFQFFEEQAGETIIGELAETFFNDGVCTAFIPWVNEKREARDTKLFEPIPDDMEPPQYFDGLLRQEFPDFARIPKNDGWDFDVSTPEEGEKFEVRFYTKGNEVEMVIIREVEVYDGPCVIVKDYDDIFHPVRAANLRIPGPSNPGGASHVIMRDYPTVDEIKRLAKSKYYDLITKEELDALENVASPDVDTEAKKQKDDLGGKAEPEPEPAAKSHRTLTRLMCFDMFDIDGDGIDEDMVFWVIEETRTLVKAVALTELFPASPPRRPFAEATFLPVKGRRAGISLPELLEGMHDAMKMLYDQTIDSGTLRVMPVGFYRASGSMKQETIRLSPGDLYPLGDPQKDINYPKMGDDNAVAFMLNMISMLGTNEERVSSVGDLELGRVPAGKSSALRTIGGMALIAGQGEARPERILRRFFVGLTEIWQQIHELNQHFLPKDKQIRIFDMPRPSADPYQTITDKGEISGRFQFSFSANVLNTSKAAMQEALLGLAPLYISELAFQTGIMQAPGFYRYLRDVGKSQGQDPDKYLTEPTPGAGRPTLTAEEAISQILNSQIPDGEPAEGAQAHLQALQAFIKTDELGNLSPDQNQLLKGYIQTLHQKIQEEQQRQAMIEAARNFGPGQQNGQGGRPPEGVENPNQQPPVQGGELLDETLPSAGGGGAVQ